jgi:hypothetical protein
MIVPVPIEQSFIVFTEISFLLLLLFTVKFILIKSCHEACVVGANMFRWPSQGYHPISVTNTRNRVFSVRARILLPLNKNKYSFSFRIFYFQSKTRKQKSFTFLFDNLNTLLHTLKMRMIRR